MFVVLLVQLSSTSNESEYQQLNTFLCHLMVKRKKGGSIHTGFWLMMSRVFDTTYSLARRAKQDNNTCHHHQFTTQER